MNAKAGRRASSSKGAPSHTKPPFSFSSLLPSITIPLSSPIWTLIEKFYAIPPPSNPPPKRTKPMRVLCVGLPRSGTESLQQALLILGYDYTYHGWDIVYPPPSASDSDPDSEPHTDAQLWTSLARAKFHPYPASESESESGSESSSLQSGLSASDFDQILSRSQAVTDAPGSLFASELITCFPEAKVILNQRRDTQKWKTSILNTLVKANESWAFYLASWFGPRECFWAWHVYERFLWPRLFGVGPGETLRDAVEKRAEIVSRDHCNMIRGMLKNNPERLLEWYIEDGWAPLCKFLGRPIPDVPFPHVNAANGGWKAREEQCNKRWVEKAFLRLIGTGLLLALVAFWLAVRG